VNIHLNSANKKFKPEYILYPAFAILVMATAGFPFFWDTVQLASRHADYFYNTDFKSIILPNEIDSGHIPAMGIYLAAIWKIFGRSLVASHLAMLPFVLGIVFQAGKLARKYFPLKWQFPALVIILLDPVLLAQCTLVSPDVLLVFFFLMAVNNISEKNRIFYSIALAGLALSSMRGMMCVAGFFAADAILKYVTWKKSVRKQKLFTELTGIIIPYLPAILIAGAFFSWHLYKTGWIGYHADMPWYPLFERVNFSGALRNTLILGWRLIDFGHLFVWITAFACLLHYFRNKPSLTDRFVMLSVISVTLLISIAHAFILHANLSAHRYLLPVYLIFTTLVCYYLFNNSGITFPRKFFTWLLITGLLSGNFWIYPDRIAKGWDSTLAYLPYFPLRKKMMNYMEKEGIKMEETGTLFPNTGPIDRIELNGDMRSFAEKNLNENKYFFYSNIFNDLTDNELNELQNHWIPVKGYRILQVKIILYMNPSKDCQVQIE
jgi:hypothetical protein